MTFPEHRSRSPRVYSQEGAIGEPRPGQGNRLWALMAKAKAPKNSPAETVRAPQPPEAETNDASRFPIVGIGASAGGLAAFEAFFSGMPADKDPGMAFVLVQHLAPDHKSILTELITRYTRMKVYEVEDGMVVEPNCAYIIPPNKDMAFLNGTLQLLDPTAPRGQRLPIDFFFRSLADDQHERALCIVLSGTGSDGTLGLRAIKGEGGMAMAQNPESTEFDGMPSSAIATGLVDYILPAAEMPAQLIAYAAHAFVGRQLQTSAATPHGEDEMKKALVLLRARTGNDFSLYKQSTVTRRIERRMAVNQIERIEDYVRYLQEVPDEVDALFRDLLIGVTSFFRDPEVFAALEEEAIARILARKAPGDPIRVWIPACSTGEEAYSLAILLKEQMERQKTSHDIKIFATDIDSRAIDTARSAVYPSSIVADVSPERLRRFFVTDAEESGYRLQKSIRDMVIFSVQNVIKDPPFSQVDLLSCRNLLIYLGAPLQAKLIPLFHYALKPGGFLCVGTSESACGFTDLFEPVAAKEKIYLRKDAVATARGAIVTAPVRRLSRDTSGPKEKKRALATDAPLRELIEQELLARPEPVAALVNEHGDILYLHGRAGLYLEPNSGKPTANILRMAREGLGRELATVLRQAVMQRETISRTGIAVKTNGDFTSTDLIVSRVETADALRGDTDTYLVVLEASRQLLSPAPDGTDEDDKAVDTDSRVTQLRAELQSKEEYLQAALEEMETSNEEMQSTNEEMQSTNEELQSVNEELETSKEELQSVNEELATVNAELQQRVSDLSRVNNDMNNLLAGTGIGTLFVDGQLRIQRFTPAATRVINLVLSDVGRPLTHITLNLAGYDHLAADAQRVIDTLQAVEVEVQTHAAEWYLLRIRPYRTVENVIDGVAITFTDITELKRAQLAVLESNSKRRMAVIIGDSSDAILVCDLDGRILTWNPRASRAYGWTEEEALTMNIRELIPEPDRAEALEVTLQLASAEVLEPYRMRRVTKDGRVITVTLTATILLDGLGKAYAVSMTERGA